MSFADEVRRATAWPWKGLIGYKTAIFRQINKDKRGTHHDALEFPDGRLVLLTLLLPGQQATVLQLPAATESIKAKEQPAVSRAVELDLADTFRLTCNATKSPDDVSRLQSASVQQKGEFRGRINVTDLRREGV